MEETTNATGGAAPSPKPEGAGNKNMYIIIGVVILLLFGFLSMKGEKPGAQLLGESGKSMPTSLKALMALGVPQQCTFNVKNESSNGTNESSGEVYLSGNKMRMDTESHMMMGGKDVIMGSHMLSDGEFYYMWSDEDKTHGMKMKMTDEMMKGAEGQNQQKPPVDPDMAMDYKCTPSVSDASKLEVPKDITFMDMNEMMNGMMKDMPAGMPKTGTTVKGGTGDTYPTGAGSEQMKAMQCSACDQAGDQKAACLAALGC